MGGQGTPTGNGAASSLEATGRPDQEAVSTLLVGDSIAFTIARAMGEVAHRFPVRAQHGTMIGCGIARGGPIRDAGLTVNVPDDCGRWPDVWRHCVDSHPVDVAAVLVGRWEVVDRVHAGRWTHVGDPDFDAYLRRELELGIEILQGAGAQVLLVTAPYCRQVGPDGCDFPQNEPGRTDRFNVLLAEVAADCVGVEVVDLNARLCPDGNYVEEIEGMVLRRGDGIHLTRAASTWVAEWLLAEMVALGRSDRLGAVG